MSAFQVLTKLMAGWISLRLVATANCPQLSMKYTNDADAANRPFGIGTAIAIREKKLFVFNRLTAYVYLLDCRGGDVRAWTKTISKGKSDGWKGAGNPPFNLAWANAESRTARSRRQRVAGEAMRRFVPENLRRTICAFRCRHWQLLQALVRAPGRLHERNQMLELAEANPALFFAAANAWCFSKAKSAYAHRWRVCRRLVDKRHRDISAYLGFRRSKRIARLMSAIAPSDVTIWGLMQLKEVLNSSVGEKVAKTLGFLRRRPLTGVVLQIVCDESLFSIIDGNRFLQEVQQLRCEHSARRVLNLLCDADQMAAQCGVRISIQSIAHLRRVHDELADHILYEVAVNEGAETTYPPPVIPSGRGIGDDGLEYEVGYVRDLGHLLRLAREFRNCLASRHNILIRRGPAGQGHSFVYEVRGLGRAKGKSAVLELTIRSYGPCVREIAGPRNCQVSRSVREAVRDWLENAVDMGSVWGEAQVPGLPSRSLEEVPF